MTQPTATLKAITVYIDLYAHHSDSDYCNTRTYKINQDTHQTIIVLFPLDVNEFGGSCY